MFSVSSSVKSRKLQPAGRVEARAFPQLTLDPIRRAHPVVTGGERLDLAVPHREVPGELAAVDQPDRMIHDPVECALHRLLRQQVAGYSSEGTPQVIRRATFRHLTLPDGSD